MSVPDTPEENPIDQLLALDDAGLDGDIDEIDDETLERYIGTKEDVKFLHDQRGEEPGEPAAAAPAASPDPAVPPTVEPVAPAVPVVPAEPAAAAGPAAPAPGEVQPEQVPDPPAPEWVEQLPPEGQEYIKQLRDDSRGQRIALAKRGRQVQERDQRIVDLDFQRRTAQAAALIERDKAAGAGPQGGDPAKTPAPAIPVTQDDEGNLTIKPEALARAVTQPSGPPAPGGPAITAEVQNRMAAIEPMIADIPPEVQFRLMQALNESGKALYQATLLEGVTPRDVTEQIALLRRHGFDTTLQTQFPGVTIEDLADMSAGGQNPQAQGHLIQRVARKARDLWAAQPAPGAVAPNPGAVAGAVPATVPVATVPAAPAGRPTVAPTTIPEHPTPLGTKGEQGIQTGTPSMDAIIGMNDIDRVLNMSDKEMGDMWRRWEAETGEVPSGPPV